MRAARFHGRGDRAQRPRDIATVAPRYPLDLEEQFARAVKFTGPKLFLALSPCPTGWLYDPGETPDVARLAVECGLWTLKEAINGEVVHAYMPKLQPVEVYLKLQGRFRHLFDPSVQTEAIAHIQARGNAYWQEAKKTGTAS